MEIKQKIEKINEISEDIIIEINEIRDEKLKKDNIVNALPEMLKKSIEDFKKLIVLIEIPNDQLVTFVNEVVDNHYTQLDNYSHQGYYANSVQKYVDIEAILINLRGELKRIDYLSLIGDKNVVLVGGNGVGKSSFASYLKESLSNNIIVVPAQKILFYNSNINALHLTGKNEMKNIQEQNFIGQGKFNQDNNYAAGRYINELSELFSKLVTVIANEQVKEEHKVMESNEFSDTSRDNTILYKINKLWQTLIPDIILELDTTNRTLIPKKNNQVYSLNSLSDGEKAILYYICLVFLAESNSFIVVDEPETFLNVSNFNRLWDTLESYRDDCKFIYISHVIDFIVTRSNAEMLWCKKFSYPDYWEIIRLDHESNLEDIFPKELLSEILGARKPILFCEGEKNSLDYFVYTNLFREEVIVCPVGGHTKVIEYTRAYNNSPTLDNNIAFGIIDSDLMNEHQILKYKEDSIYTLPFNEIEMIFFTKEVIDNTLNHSFSEKVVDEKTTKFIKKFFDIVNQDKEEIVAQTIKKFMDNQLSNYRINENKSTMLMVKEVNLWIEGLSIPDLEINVRKNLEQVILDNDFNEMLKVAPQKNAISRGLANKELDNNYMEKAMGRLSRDNTLVDVLKKRYFKDIIF